MVHISANFDAGNIEVVDATDPRDIQLKIRKDAGGDHMQWFFFRVTGAAGTSVRMRIVNADEVSFPEGWTNYRACYSYDRETWQRLETTTFEDGILQLAHEPLLNSVYYAYFAPYSMERHHDLVASCCESPRVEYERLGASVDGQDMDLLRVSEGETAGKKQCWIFARQHPGESMAEWLMEGLLARLLDPDDPVARELLAKAVFWIVPNMNPDGSRRGHLRNNAAGANLNREWLEPTMARSPEVFLVRRKMQDTGLDFALDVHGDEALPYNFIAGSEGVEGLSEKVAALQAKYEAELVAANPDFQTKHGYPVPGPGQANMTMATNWIAGHFDKLSMTLEQPFKDNADAPDEDEGWSPERCRKLGEGVLAALYRVIDEL
ncbi:carboxypeptidase family protein [Pseudenhygromyxa sp. WMMC2535]|uniref:M14 family metallopeptidase n=1 Tax=Pseudenhygromyxa sp. WMMC2535 TaxID=2712867 RepID=UPI001552B168|nr:carboxypeptidase family protein [Pseudenhygromyxa sp. WMMC2535]NVB37608.1 carboxypeptidase family protein [Pseudenhygromyxa sp. WMMC2535]